MDPSLEPREQRSRGFPGAFIIGGVLVLAAVGAVWLISSTGAGDTALPPLPFGPEEQKYAERIRFLNFKLSRAENMLGHEITIIECTIENVSTGTVREIEVELEFYNLEDQMILREERRLLGRHTPPMGGGRFRQVDMNFESIPAGWNQRAPKMRIIGLDFEP